VLVRLDHVANVIVNAYCGSCVSVENLVARTRQELAIANKLSTPQQNGDELP